MPFSPVHAQYFANKMGLIMPVEMFTLEDLAKGMNVELEHGTRDPATNVTKDDLITTGKIALAHLREFPDYYSRLEVLEKEADKFWQGKSKRRTCKRYRLKI